MKFRSFFGILLVCLLILQTALPAAAAEVPSGGVYCFSPGDFSQSGDLAGICITSVPSPEAGVLMLGSRVLQPGDILTAQQAGQITFHPTVTETDLSSSVTYLPIYSDRVESAQVMAIAVIGKADKVPVAEDSALETYRNLPNEGLLKAKDPEGQPLSYTVTRYPKRGDVVIREDGSFVYTPKKNKVGIDSFTYTASDPAGNISRQATVTVTILKPSDAAQYADTAGKSCRFAAEWMKNTGIFISENINGNGCFQPEKQVSRGEFLTMLVGALDIETDQHAVYTGYADESPEWLKPYLAAAMRLGLTAGLPGGREFGCSEPITGAEAAVMLQNALDLTAETVTADEAVPVWAQMAVSALREQGFPLDPAAPLTRGQAAEVIYRVAQLKDTSPAASVLRAAQ
jgi:hypothetical protein